VYSPAAEKFQDLEYIRKTVLVEIEEVQGKTKRADTEYHAILHSVTINLQLYRGTNNTGSPLVDIRELLAGATKVKEYRNLLREMEQALKQSLQFSVRLVEVKAAVSSSMMTIKGRSNKLIADTWLGFERYRDTEM